MESCGGVRSAVLPVTRRVDGAGGKKWYLQFLSAYARLTLLSVRLRIFSEMQPGRRIRQNPKEAVPA